VSFASDPRCSRSRISACGPRAVAAGDARDPACGVPHGACGVRRSASSIAPSFSRRSDGEKAAHSGALRPRRKRSRTGLSRGASRAWAAMSVRSSLGPRAQEDPDDVDGDVPVASHREGTDRSIEVRRTTPSPGLPRRRLALLPVEWPWLNPVPW
jgi:hypothetical protein